MDDPAPANTPSADHPGDWEGGGLEKGEWVDEVCAVEDTHTYMPGNAAA